MVGTLLARGMLVGIVASVVCFGFLKLYGEPQVDRAIAFEAQLDETKAVAANTKNMDISKHEHLDISKHEHLDMSKHEHAELVGRPVQAGIGLFIGLVVYCTSFGGLFALAFAFAYGRATGASPQAVSAVLAATGFIAIYVVPNLKYPASPPSVGDAETIGIRTALYFIMIAISILAMVGSVGLKSRLIPRYGEWNATLIVAAIYVAVVAVAGLLLPAINEVPEQFPAVVLWQFRIASMGAQAIMWATIGLLFGALTQRASTASSQ